MLHTGPLRITMLASSSTATATLVQSETSPLIGWISMKFGAPLREPCL